MDPATLITTAQNTWCPGCGNFSIEHALKDVLATLIGEGLAREKIVLVTGIGCHAKIADYLAVNSVYAIHGRTIPVATGLLLANPDLTIICCAGDGDAYAEGLDHLVFAAKRNVGITCLVHDNRVYGLTTGQYTPTSPRGFRGRSTPGGSPEDPLNPAELILAAGGSFIARGYTRRLPHLKTVIREAILHRGFSFIDILQICATYNNMTAYYEPRVYELPGPVTDPDESRRLVREWDYLSDSAIALGVLAKVQKPRFEENFLRQSMDQADRDEVIRLYLAEKT